MSINLGESKLEFNSETKLHEYNVSRAYQGHSMMGTFKQADGKNIEHVPPFIVRYNLYSPFETFRTSSTNRISNLSIGDESNFPMQVSYKGGMMQLNFEFLETNEHVTIIEISSKEFKTQEFALNCSNFYVNLVLDGLTFQFNTPIDIYSIEILDSTRKYSDICWTVPIVHSKTITKDVLNGMITIPKKFKSCIKLYREAMNSVSSSYRLLCLYKIVEHVLKDLRKEHNDIMRKHDIKIERPVRMLSEDKVIKEAFPEHAGKKVTVFTDFVRENYRRHIAHLNKDEKGNLIIQSTNRLTDHIIDIINFALEGVVRELLHDEIEVYNRIKHLL